ncbi:MAG TPA: type II toxin-antitoxin system RelE/ParE family toxin [Woeseiaceae bacterium]|nr:type II toxin-antitoxin system RelE/ParE family toxin [Woeseiaceae bacterium]
MFQLRQTATFAKWLHRLRDKKAKARILSRLDSFKLGHLGDCKTVGGRIREMRVHIGAGYRVYFVQQGELVVILLCGGSKSSQSRDIERAARLLEEIEELK